MQKILQSQAENILKRQIAVAKELYTFYPQIVDNYHQISGYDKENPLEVVGLFHEAAQKVQTTDDDGARVRTIWKPAILTLIKLLPEGLAVDMLVKVSNSFYTVTQIKDVSQGGFAVDIILEEINNDNAWF